MSVKKSKTNGTPANGEANVGTKGKLAGKELWQEQFDTAPKRAGAIDRTISDHPLKPMYGPEDLAGLDYDRDLSYPGQYPYTRGIHPTMYRGRLWTMRQFAGFGTAKQTNERFHFLLAQGQTGLSVAFDMPALMGYDSDHPRALGEVGKCGVAIATLQDMQDLMAGIDLGRISTSMTINCTAPVALALYIVAAELQGVPQEKLSGTLQADMLKEYIAQKEWIYPPEPSMRIITDMMAYCAKHVPKWNTISISGYHIREAGSTAVQELAFTLADGFAYVEAGIAAGHGRRRVCAASFVFLQCPLRLLRRDRKVSGRAADLGASHARALQGKKPALVDAALPHPNRWLLGNRAAGAKQHHARGLSSNGRRPRRHAIAAHEFIG